MALLFMKVAALNRTRNTAVPDMRQPISCVVPSCFPSSERQQKGAHTWMTTSVCGMSLTRHRLDQSGMGDAATGCQGSWPNRDTPRRHRGLGES
jgi:hypothetical protein